MLYNLLSRHGLDRRALADGTRFQEILEECPVVNNRFAQIFRAGFAARSA